MSRVAAAAERAELDQTFHRLVARRDTQLAVHRDEVGLDGVAADVEPLPHLGHGQSRGQQRDQAQLGRSQRRQPKGAASVNWLTRSSSSLVAVTSVPRSGRCCRMPRTWSRASRASLGRSGPGGASQLEQRLDRYDGQRVGEQRTQPGGISQVAHALRAWRHDGRPRVRRRRTRGRWSSSSRTGLG